MEAGLCARLSIFTWAELRVLSIVVLRGNMNSEEVDRIEVERNGLKESKPAEKEHLRGDNDKAEKMV
jgi:hypothetical protein